MLTHRSRLEGIFAPRSPLEFIGFSVVTGMLGLLSAGNWLGFTFVPLFALGWWWFDRQRNQQRAAATRVSIDKDSPQPARGLLLLVSPYDPRDNRLRDPAVLAPLLDRLLKLPALAESDFEAINLFGSNLLPQIRAIEYHLRDGSLQEVWLITSESYGEVKGSEGAAAILECYLRWQYGNRQLAIHRQNLTVKEFDYRGLWQVGEQIFSQSAYKDEVMVADITGGTKMMSVAIAMACIPPKRRMQYMDSQRDWQGNPLKDGEMLPIAIDVDPILYLPD